MTPKCADEVIDAALISSAQKATEDIDVNDSVWTEFDSKKETVIASGLDHLASKGEAAKGIDSESLATQRQSLILASDGADPVILHYAKGPNSSTKRQSNPTTQVWFQLPVRLQNPLSGDMMRMPLLEDLRQMITELQDHSDWFEENEGCTGFGKYRGRPY